MFTIVRPEPRIMSGTGIGSWLETVPDTCYRNNFGWLICRSRGKGNGGRITGQRFYVIARDGAGKPHKMRSKQGRLRYFDGAPAAAFAAVEYANMMAKAWSKAKLVSDIEALELQRKSLMLDVAHLNKTKGELQSYVARLNGWKKRPSASVQMPSPERKPTADGPIPDANGKYLEAIAQLPSFMHKTVTHLFRQDRPH